MDEPKDVRDDQRTGFGRREVDRLSQGMGTRIVLLPPASLTIQDLRDIHTALETGEGKERAIGLLDTAIALGSPNERS